MLAINVAKSTFIASFGIKSIIIAKKSQKSTLFNGFKQGNLKNKCFPRTVISIQQKTADKQPFQEISKVSSPENLQGSLDCMGCGEV